MRPSSLLTSSLLLAASSSAWDFFGTPSKPEAQIERRQDEPFDLSWTGRQGDTNIQTATPGSRSGNDAADATASLVTRTNSEGDLITATASASRGSNSDDDDEIDVDPRLPPGGISMLTPDALTGQKYFKIHDNVTFAWNYTSLSVKPTYVDVLATCTQNQATYTIALNQSFQQTQEVIWDTGDYQATGTVPLLTETYTLIVHDAAEAVSARAKPGYLASYQQFSFGMYVPQKYTPMAEYKCATCSGAIGLAGDRQTLGFLAGMVLVTVVSFGWFAGVAGVW
ncbi:hypothetical protein MBLNU230_g3417t1 [Neophaeotheca triangularis]